MSAAPDPAKIFCNAAEEGRRRLGQSLLELAATGFIAGFTIVLGIVAFGIARAVLEPVIGEAAKLGSAMAFAVGLVLLIVQRAELFSENFFDPIAAVFEDQRGGLAGPVARLWSLTLIFNLLGGTLLALLVTVEHVLPSGATDALAKVAEELVARPIRASFVSAVIGGALVALLSYALQGAHSVTARIVMAFFAGFLLAVGPFDHVIVTALHVFIGLLVDARVTPVQLAELAGIATLGNLVGGVGLVAFSHAAQAKGSNRAG
ncbi:formate/nitrite transporter family protein [Lysobacter korlensis]|uniref:Formate/nitrite transporter family protein n=1 Tax=Lysobacter korlensis TaxID=553636 RepID=A0ABV6RS77_9GAMM